MSETIIVAVISGVVTLVGVLIANSKAQAVTDTKLEALAKEVREHNDFAKRVPLLEEQMKEVRKDVEELQGFHKRQ